MRNMILSAVCSFWLFPMFLLGDEPIHADLSLGDLQSLYMQNQIDFTVMEIHTTWSEETLAAAKETMKQMDANLQQELSSEEKRKEFARFLRTQAPDNQTSSLSDDELVERALQEKARSSMFQAQTDAPKKEIHYIVMPNRIEMRVPVPGTDPRRLAAEQKNIASFTGGPFDKIQQRGEKWLCLNPYPFVNLSSANATINTRWPIEGVLPLYVDGKMFETPHNHYLDGFWDDPSSIQFFGVGTGSLESVYLLAKRRSDTDFVFVAVSVSGARSYPHWVSSWVCTTGGFENLDLGQARLLAEQVESLRDPTTVSALLDLAFPRQILFFGDYKKIDNAGWYPHQIIHALMNTVRLTASDAEKDWRELPVGWMKKGVLEIQSIRVNGEVTPVEPIELPEGTSLVDMDSSLSLEVKANTNEAIELLLSREAARKNLLPASMLCGALAILLLLTLYVFRRRSAKKQTTQDRLVDQQK